jgi:RimJ/RimL family protein N-acetyltransferase
MRQDQPLPGAWTPQAGSTPPATGSSGFCFQVFGPAYADRVASWAQSDRELTWLAPGTLPPLTGEKVMAWGRNGGRRLLFCPVPGDGPVGYAELNQMPLRSSHLWIGHFVLDPAWRGRSLGVRFAGALLASAFLESAAAEVVLVVFPDNLAAIRCYERSGFVMTGQESKFLETTQREHLFLRMSISATRYYRLAAAGRLPGRPLDCRVAPP